MSDTNYKGTPIYLRDLNEELQRSVLKNANSFVESVHLDDDDEREIIVGHFLESPEVEK